MIDSVKAVVADKHDNTSGNGDIWFNHSERQVWVKEPGMSASPVYCYSIIPAIGLSVVVS